MEWKDASLATPLLSGASGSTIDNYGSTQSLDEAQSAPNPKPQHHTPLEDSDTEQPAGRAAVVMMPDGSLVPVSSTASLSPSAHRTDVRSVEQYYHPTEHPSEASASATNLLPLPPKPDGAPGPAPSGGPYHPQTYAGATPGPPLTSPIPGPAPDHMQQKSDMPVPGPAPDGHPQQTPAQHMHPAAQPAPPYPPPQPYNQHQFPHSQYQPPPPVPIMRYEQGPQVIQRKPLKTSKTFNTKTLIHNQYYLSILLCYLLSICCNPLAIICFIPGFHFASKAMKEDKNNNYAKALELERKAQYFNIVGLIFWVGFTIIFFFMAGTTAIVFATLFSKHSS